MRWSFTRDVEEFAAVAEPWLLRDPAGNTVLLTVLLGLRAGQFAEDPLMGWLEDDDGEVAGVITHTPPYPLGIADMPLHALPPLARELIEMDRTVHAARGAVEMVEAFGREWWRPETSRRAERLYRLGTLAPCAVPGRACTVTAGEVDEAARWFREFQDEAHIDRTADPTPVVSARVNREELIWWEDGDRRVSLAALSTPVAGMSRIGPVYTPPEFRRRGYGSAATHAVSRRAMDEGATEVLLFADLSNPTSNSIYRRLGFRQVANHLTIDFS
ncbi:GNAT family N-acetyltransferase [Sphaerimonospora sp. CA-214678]|uniref:GNAT family N-acetyltransferase n=1 Tax=Sphaerimonospora sp. CA-214678 TaxID=3240029 RepID=UPI003D914D4D